MTVVNGHWKPVVVAAVVVAVVVAVVAIVAVVVVAVIFDNLSLNSWWR